MKFKLQIQYPITAADMHLMHFDSISVSWIYDRNGKDISDGECRIEGIPESWLTPIEDKPITAEEYIYEMFDGKKALDKDDEHEFSYNEMKESFDYGDENGQLKQWINHTELREACESLASDYKISHHHSMYEDIFKALKNIKPHE